MKVEVRSSFIETSFGGEVGHWIVVGEVDLVLLPDDCIQMGCKDVAEAGSHDDHVVSLEIGRSSLALVAESQGKGVTCE
jgi:hypothetical protein